MVDEFLRPDRIVLIGAIATIMAAVVAAVVSIITTLLKARADRQLAIATERRAFRLRLVQEALDYFRIYPALLHRQLHSIRAVEDPRKRIQQITEVSDEAISAFRKMDITTLETISARSESARRAVSDFLALSVEMRAQIAHLAAANPTNIAEIEEVRDKILTLLFSVGGRVRRELEDYVFGAGK
jgi:hypothetical protein